MPEPKIDSMTQNNVTLLYVDDEPINLKLFEINFKKKYRVLTAESGLEGLKKLENNTDIIVVISDMRMPGMNGIEFVRKAKEQFVNIAYFILTDFEYNDEISKALEEKIILEYFRKPFNLMQIEQAIEKAIAQIK